MAIRTLSLPQQEVEPVDVFPSSLACHLSVAHVQQQNNGECLAACAMMISAYLGFRVSYRQLVRTLGIRRGLGTPFSHVQNLQTLGIGVIYSTEVHCQECSYTH